MGAFPVPRANSPFRIEVESDPDYEKHKADSLAKQKQGAGHWKPELASDSEEAVKADRSPTTPNETAKLQEQTKKAAEETAKRGTSNVQQGM